MTKQTFLEGIKEARAKRYAVGAFNIFNYLSARAVIEAARQLNAPVILQTSVKTVRQFGARPLMDLLRPLALRAKNPVWIHLDHCTDLLFAKECVEAGWDAVMYDGSALPFDQNVENSRQIAIYAHQRGVFVEGELGRIVGVEEDIEVEHGQMATLEESLAYVKQTGVDAFAPAIGTAHGVYKGVPVIQYDLVKQLKERIETPVVIHGGTGLSEAAFKHLIANGGAKVNVSTALKHAYMEGCAAYLKQNPDKREPIALEEFLQGEIEKAAAYHIRLFQGGGDVCG